MATALQLKREGWQAYVEAARRRPAIPAPAPDGQEALARAQLLERVRQAVTRLKATFSVRRTVLFGSLAHQGWFAPDSDVDLAVEGLRPADYWEAWGLLEDCLRDRSVDLIELETASESLREAVERYGIEL
jgi:predicted nucleotidyltransferase